MVNSPSFAAWSSLPIYPACWRTSSAFSTSDLAYAGIAKKDADDRTVDVHPDVHRDHTFATLLSKAGVVPRMAQELMRHSPSTSLRAVSLSNGRGPEPVEGRHSPACPAKLAERSRNPCCVALAEQDERLHPPPPRPRP